jgi:cobalt-zinc-cadmium efflux system protein
MNHGHHDHAAFDHNRAFAVGVALNVLFVVVEGVFGLLADSLALLADAGHNLSDVLSLLLAWGASYLAQRPPTRRRTYGLRRSTILASLLNAVILLVAVGAIGWEAIRRLGSPASVATGTMMIVAGVGVIVNTATALLFLRGRHLDLNVKGAFLHMAADAGISIGVLVAGLAIRLTQAEWIDPAVSLAIALVIAIGTWGLFHDSMNLALDAVPAGLDSEAIEAWLRQVDGVAEVHDLHIWAMSTTETALTAHLVMPEAPADDGFLHRLACELHDRFHIGHSTIQIERGDAAWPCELAPHARV